MNRPPYLDFAIDRVQQRRWQHRVVAFLGLVLGLQAGFVAWEFQSLRAERARLVAQSALMVQNGARAGRTELLGEKTKIAVEVHSMLRTLKVPWEDLFLAIESASNQEILIDAIQPNAEEGVVNISVSAIDFDACSKFVGRLSQQALLREVMLKSETATEGGSGPLRAVVTAKWVQAK